MAPKTKAAPVDSTTNGRSLTATPVRLHDQPIAPTPEEQLVKDFGLSGLNRLGGYIHEEFLPELRGQKGQRLLKEMRENDPTVGAMLFLLEAMIKQVDWTVKPAGETPDQAAQDDAEYVRQCLFEDMSKTWPDVLSEICSMFWAGYAPLEMTWKRRLGPTPGTLTLESGATVPQAASQYNDGRWAWDKWSVRAQETVVQWEFDARNEWQAFVQQAPPDFILRTVPRDKVLLFRVKADRENPEGRSLLRSAYTSWAKKKKIEVIEGIGVERKLAGFPVLTPPEGADLWNPNDPNAVAQLSAAKTLVKSVRMDEQMGMVKPFGWTFELLSGDSGRQATDTNIIINRYDHRMAMTIAMDFVFLGAQGEGARAQSVVDVQLFNTALTGILDGIAETINRVAIPKLFALNGQTPEALPKLMHGAVGSPNLTALASYISSLAQAGMALFPDKDLEHSLREFAGLPEPVGGTAKPAALQPKPSEVPPQPVAKRRFYQQQTDRQQFIEAVKVLRDGVAKLVKGKS